MNEIPRAPRMRPTTQAAEGVPRLRWTLEEFERLTELGIFSEDDRIELIDGELVPVSPKGNRHELVRDELQNWLMRRLPATLRLSAEIGWRPPGADTYVEPDLLICPMAFKGVTVAPADVLLAIEVAHSSLRFDTTAKARLDATLGVREYWVVNAGTLATRIHRQPSGGHYGDVVELASQSALSPLYVPHLVVRLCELSID
jgi:Uma2 family endonuclease